jgi:hypothetical protein
MNGARAVALLWFLAACRTGESSEQIPYRTVIDTVGDTLVARTTGDVPERLLHRLVPEWRTANDAIDSSATFGDISGMAVAPDGRVFVWDHATPTLWLVDANGSSMKRLTRAGNGPGETNRANGIAMRRDGGVVLWDESNARLNIYGADGAYRSSSSVGFSHCCPGGAVTVDTQDRVWLRAWVGGPPVDKSKGFDPNNIGREVTAFMRFDSSGTPLDTVVSPRLPGDFPTLRAINQSRTGVSMSARVVPYATSTVYAVSPEGFVLRGQGRPYVVHAQSNGRPLRIERELTRVPVLDDDVRTWQWDGPEIPTEKPAYTGIAVAQDGRIWVSLSVPSEKYEPDPPPTNQRTPVPQVPYRSIEKRWDVFESDGRYVGRVVAPRLFSAYVMRGNFVWGVLRDDDDVPSVVKMRIDGQL